MLKFFKKIFIGNKIAAMIQQPKKYLDKFRVRNHAFGVERRRNMSKIILERGTPFPKEVTLSDIDECMYEWVDKAIDLVYDGKKLPTYKLYSFQRLSEYAQTWKNLDDKGNLILNFKSVSRDNNPQKGNINNGIYNIPGHKDFAMFYVPVMQENGTEAYDKYTMKQPVSVDLTYSVSIITNKMSLLNDMSEKMQYEFSAINVYISPNDHPMSMSLEEVSDDSEYSIDDWRYYSCTYKIKVRAYIIRKEDYSVERVPSIIKIHMGERDSNEIRKGKNRESNEIVQFADIPASMEPQTVDYGECEVTYNPKPQSGKWDIDVIEETVEPCYVEKSRYYNKRMSVIIDFGDCDKSVEFEIDKDMNLESIETENIYDFVFMVNGEVMDFMTDVNLLKGDRIKINISKEDDFSQSKMTVIGYDPNEVIDSKFIPESQLDEVSDEEEIEIKTDKED